MLGKREQDARATVHFRADRVSLVNGSYFFSTRENTLEGPFPSRNEAVKETEAYIKRMQGYNSEQSSELNG
ncbi:DUF6316 family protein [Xanthomonas sp. WHRI 1810A]|uniref:DUF6316 family protein n=1 Tax=Xanthomonas sp. WHRI 1810A TaxID=3161565 RepID=UPI0032E8529D